MDKWSNSLVFSAVDVAVLTRAAPYVNICAPLCTELNSTTMRLVQQMSFVFK